MKKFLLKIVCLLSIFAFGVFSVACEKETDNVVEDNEKDKKYSIVATTTMLKDLVKNIGGEHIEAKGLMGPGIDPHLYKASAGDVTVMEKADMIVYNGLHLEGKMGEVFEGLTSKEKLIICIEEGLNKEKLLKSEDNQDAYDPHVWFDVSLWKEAAKEVTKGLEKLAPENKEEFNKNLESYFKELDELDKYVKEQIDLIPNESRVLITAHDAFGYFGNAYGLEVKGLQGISTASEAGTGDVIDLSDYIVDKKIKAIFVESSIPKKNIEALQESVKAKGFNVEIGGELYSDSLGDETTNAKTYIGTFKSNVDIIVNALK